MPRPACFILLAAVAAPAGAAAQARDSVVRDSAGARAIERVEITAVRAPTVVGGAGAVVLSPDSLRIPPAASLDQALRELPFVLVRQNSRGEMEISVRGSESRQTAVLLDGIPLTLGWDHRVDPSLVPLTGARSITLVRGLSSLLYGPNVLGGVLEVGLTRSALAYTAVPELALAAGVDQFGSRVMSAAAGGPVGVPGQGTLEVRAGAGYRARDGIALTREVSAVSTGGGQSPAVADPDHSDLRANTDLRHADAFAALRYQRAGRSGAGAGPSFGLVASGYRAERGVPPELHVQEPRLWRSPGQSRLVAIATAGTGRVVTPFGEGDVDASVGLNVGRTEIESFESLAYDRVAGTEDDRERTATARLEADHTLGARGELRTAVTAAAVRFEERIDDGPAAHYRQRLWSVGSELAWRLPGFWRMSGGLALDGADTPESGGRTPLGRLSAWGGRVGASTLAMNASVLLHGAVSRRARVPALRELYSGSLGRFEPNPGLRPERLTAFETGATAQRTWGDLQGVLFHQRLADAVVRTTTAAGQFRRENRHQLRSTGVELLAGWRGGRVSALGDLVVQRVRVIDPAAATDARHAEHQPELRAGTTLTARLPLLALRGIGAARYTGRQYCIHPDLGTELRLQGRLRGDLGVDREWTLARTGLLRTLRATLALDNITDATVYDQCGLPQPGRTVRAGVEMRG